MPTAIYQLTVRLATDDTLMSRHDGQFTDTSFILRRRMADIPIGKSGCKVRNSWRSDRQFDPIQAPFLDLHDIRLDVMEVTLHEDED